jgi:glycosyltransferase involved in cell wall biosynthesis
LNPPEGSSGDIELSVVIPLYNEEQLLRQTAEPLLAELNKKLQVRAELLLVENGSSDETPAMAKALTENYSGAVEIRVLHLPEADYGRALREGFRQARGRFIVNFDLDYWDVEFARKGLDMMDRYDLIIAAKNIPGSEDRRPWNRLLITWGFQKVLHFLFNFSFHDTHGIKLWRTQAVRSLLEKVRFEQDIFDTELILRGISNGWRVTEVPVVVEEMRQPPLSIVPRIIRTLQDLVRLRICLCKDK